jgi:hypothetical protein
MTDYQQVFQFLGMPPLALEIAANRIQLPLDLTVPFHHYGFPPALLPLWSSEGAAYDGYWKHWFSPRKLTIVATEVAQKRRTHEVARDLPQVIRQMTLFTISWNEGIIPAARTFAYQTGVSDQELEQMERAIAEFGDHPDGWLTLPGFTEDPPLPCVPDGRGYQGDFPYRGMALTPQAVRNICTFEVEEEVRRQIAALPFAPPWFTESNQSLVFNQLLQQEDYAGAWMSLNSTGWQFPQAKDAMRRLAERVEVPGFGLLADAWINEPHGATPVTADTTSY